MIIFPKKDIIPIIVPSLCYNDKYNDCNSYNEMNPSIFIDKYGNVTILIRCVNYKKYPSKQFTIYGQNSNSIYFIANGKINDREKLNIENFEFNMINYEYNLPSYQTYWAGLEDIRFLDDKNILVNVPQLNENGNPAIFKAEIDNNLIKNFIKCQPSITEKNWMPYNINNEYKVIYSLTPFIIKSIETEENEIIEISDSDKIILEGYHGSTNGIVLNKYERLFLIHINKDRIIHRWLLFNIQTKSILISDEFVFFKNSYIEFTCSISNYNDRVFISVGVNDNKAYIIETNSEDIIKTFTIENNNPENYPTIVTMLYDIRGMEDNKIERNRKLESYIDFSKQFLLKLPYPMIFFIDDNEITINSIFNARKENNLINKTYIFVNDFKNTYFYKYLSRLQELQTQFHIINGEIEHETPLYVILNNNKFDSIDKAIKLNPFKSSHFIWMDFGINHVSQNNERIHDWINNVPDKIKQMCINPYTEDNSHKEHFRFIYHNMAGGLFSGSADNMLKYSELFKKKTEEIYNDNWYQIDEAVMTIVNRENPDLFDLYYGDYTGIVSNYLYPIHNIDLILKASKKYIDKNDIKNAYNILLYCSKFFENEPYNQNVLNYIQQHMICDYYYNNKCLIQNVIDLINMLKINNREIILILLENNKSNIDFYDNKHLII